MNKFLALTSAAAAVLMTTGCKSEPTLDEAADAGWQDPFFPSKSSVPASKTIWETSYANAAVEDGMLYTTHFTGNELNGLGQRKVDLMMKGRTPGVALSVYLNQNTKDATNNDRVAAITRALTAAGLAEADFKVVVGPNPSTLAPASAGIRALARAEGAGATASDDEGESAMNATGSAATP